MKLNTCITEGENNYVVITEMSDGKQYLPEGSALTAKNRFIYTDTASIDVFRLNGTAGNYYTPAVIVNRAKCSDSPQIKLSRDGWFTAIHIVVPTQDWVYEEMSKNGSIIRTYDIVYFTDGGSIYTYKDGKIAPTTIESLLKETSSNSTISRVDTDYVSISIISSNLVATYSAILENRMYNGGCTMDVCDANRLAAIIHLVKHYVRWGQFAEAERIIEKANYFTSDNTLSKSANTITSNGCGCL